MKILCNNSFIILFRSASDIGVYVCVSYENADPIFCNMGSYVVIIVYSESLPIYD